MGLPDAETFPYDAAGNRDDDDTPDTAPWIYDANHRIERSPTPGGGPDTHYAHDADGNRCKTNPGPIATSPDPCAADPGLPSEVRFVYDETNRLEKIHRADGSLVTYLYDPFGRRIRKTVAGTTTWSLWDGDRLLAEYDGAGSRTARYAYAGGFAPVEVAYPNGPGEDASAVHTDHLDTPRMLTDATGAPVWRAAYEAFGQAHVTANPGIEFHIRFPGQYYDAETGLHYNRFRYYDPSIGRYISSDPISQWGDINLYRYAFNDPLNLTDPYGLLTWGEAISRYASRRGGTLDTPFADHDPGFGPESVPGFDEALESGGSQSFTSELEYDTGEAPGRIVLTLAGTIECDAVCGQPVCYFEGEVGAKDDPWDFNEAPWGERDPGGFPYPKEVSTRIGQSIPGKSFTTRFTGPRRVRAAR